LAFWKLQFGDERLTRKISLRSQKSQTHSIAKKFATRDFSRATWQTDDDHVYGRDPPVAAVAGIRLGPRSLPRTGASVSICLLVLKGRSLPRAEMRDDALDGRPYRPCKNLRNQREQIPSNGASVPRCPRERKTCKDHHGDGKMIRRIPTLSATASMEGPYDAHSAAPRGCATGDAVLREPRDFRGIPGRAIARRETASLNLISRAWRPSSAVPAPAELPSE
jgi:hypothetical protein